MENFSGRRNHHSRPHLLRFPARNKPPRESLSETDSRPISDRFPSISDRFLSESPLAAHSLRNSFGPPERIVVRTANAEPCVPYAACLRFSPRPPLAMMVGGNIFLRGHNIFALGEGGQKSFCKNIFFTFFSKCFVNHIF